MKKAVIASILGLAISTVAALGQSAVIFDNYLWNSGIVMWTADVSKAPAGRAGTPVMTADNLVVDLQWAYSGYSGDAGLRVPVEDGGYFHGPMVAIAPPYVPGTTITFTVPAWNGLTWAESTARGSVSWIEPELFPGFAPEPGLHMPNLYVELVPEPSVLALAIFCGGMLLVNRRCD
jgi:hypothetical protein